MVMNRSRKPISLTNKQSVWYRQNTLPAWLRFFRPELRRRELSTDFLMFLEDAGLAFSLKDRSSVSVQPNIFFKRLISLSGDKLYGAADVIDNFSNQNVLYDFFVYGKVCFEIVRHEDANLVSFEHIPTHSIFNIWKFHYQYIPKSIRSDIKKSEFQKIPASNIFEIRLPRNLQKQVLKLLKVLVGLDDSDLLPKFAKTDLSEGKAIPSNYDAEYRDHLSRKILHTGAKKIGWNGREQSNRHTLEHYEWVRFLRFEKFKCQLRTTLVDGINKGFIKAFVGEQAPEIKISNVPTEQDVDDAMKFLREGGKKFSEIIAPFRNY